MSTRTGRRPEVDSARLRRALYLNVVRLRDGSCLVSGGDREHQVGRIGARVVCDCEDRVKGPCKHRLAVLLAARLPASVRTALRELVPPPRPKARRPKDTTAHATRAGIV
ncbi:MAG: SWIM zinc finger family protein [Candidatus Binatia bacterium]